MDLSKQRPSQNIVDQRHWSNPQVIYPEYLDSQSEDIKIAHQLGFTPHEIAWGVSNGVLDKLIDRYISQMPMDYYEDHIPEMEYQELPELQPIDYD